MSKPKLIFCIFPSKELQILAVDSPRVRNGDVSILIKEGDDDVVGDSYKFHVEGSGTSYSSKRNSNTKFEAGSELFEGTLLLVENTGGLPIVYNYSAESDYGLTIVEAIKTIRALYNGEEIATNRTDSIEKIFTDGGQYEGRMMTDAGTLLEYDTYALNKNTESDDVEVVTEKASFDASDRETILALVKSVLPAIVYDGFNPSSIRTAFISTNANPDIVARNLLLAFSAYAFIGNKIGKLIIRRVDKDVGQKLMNMITSLGIKKENRTKTGLTLPRIAISFMPEYLAFRRFMGADLQSQTESSIDVAFKDIVFHGCDSIRNKTGYLEFHKAFSALIYDKKKDVDLSDEGFVRNYNRWTKVTISGYRGDTAIHPRMDQILSRSEMTPTAVYDFVKTGIVDVYSN